MGRRSRQRVHSPPPAAARREPERPKAPWHPFPLVELCALVGIVLLILGLIDLDSERGRLFLITGMVLGSLAGLDTSLREHFSGFKSHSTVLAGIPAVITAAAVYFAQLPWPVVILGAIAAFALSFTLLARAHRRATARTRPR
jgi:FtsH-binding integral membrane protein